jgi:hypothetical protein
VKVSQRIEGCRRGIFGDRGATFQGVFVSVEDSRRATRGAIVIVEDAARHLATLDSIGVEWMTAGQALPSAGRPVRFHEGSCHESKLVIY